MKKKDQVITAERLERRRAAAQSNGSQGGFKRAEDYGPDVLAEWAAAGGKAVLAKYGREHFVKLRKRRWTSADLERQERADYETFRAETRAETAKHNGRRGGRARAALYSSEQRSDWARKGGIATRARYGNDFYREIRKLRKRYRKGYLTRKTKERLRETFERLANDEVGSRVASLWEFLAKKANTLTYPAASLDDRSNHFARISFDSKKHQNQGKKTNCPSAEQNEEFTLFSTRGKLLSV